MSTEKLSKPMTPYGIKIMFKRFVNKTVGDHTHIESDPRDNLIERNYPNHNNLLRDNRNMILVLQKYSFVLMHWRSHKNEKILFYTIDQNLDYSLFDRSLDPSQLIAY